EWDVDVVSAGRFCRRSEDRLGQAIGLAQPNWQFNSTNRSGLLIFLPAGAGKISARHAFHGKHLRAPHQHRSSAKLLTKLAQGLRIIFYACRDHMIRNHSAQKIKPEERKLGEDLSLIGNCARKNVVKRRNSVRSDEEEMLTRFIDVPHLALSMQHRGKVG